MPKSLGDLRFFLDRGMGLLHRGIASVRLRGWRATWRRLALERRPRGHARDQALLQADHSPFRPFTLPRSEAPRASIVIPVHGQLPHTLACLRALSLHPPRTGFEVIVVDDASTDSTPEVLPLVDGVRYHRRDANGGFIAACNDGAALARGEYLVFLNNDTVPQPGWLDALLRTFDEHPGTGLAGAQLLYPDGRLQEAGGIVFADGSAWNYGRFESPDDPRFSFVREADYCSGAALAVPRALFGDIGGFQRDYAPAYFEDTELAFSVRAAGFKVLYQPESRVVHAEGTTAGTDPARGAKAFQARNQQRFAARWRDVLAAMPGRAPPSPASIAGTRRQVLLIDAGTPTPDRDSGSLRMLNLMRVLREEGAHVVFLPADGRHAGRYTSALQQLGIEVWYGPFMQHPPRWLREHGARFDRVLVSRHHLAREFLPLLRRHAPRAKVIFDTVDLHYLREQRAAQVAGDNVLERTAARTRRLELETIAQADVTLVVSAAEQALLARDAPGARVEVLSNLHRPRGAGLPFAQRRELVFVGGFRHPPNVDAVRWFLAEVFPLVRRQCPDIVFHCIGDDVPDAIHALAGQGGVRLHGHVPDIDGFMDGCRVAVAPLRYGAGVKGKINLSMAHGQPVVATSCAIEGMHLRPGLDVLVADDAAGFAGAVVRLHGDEALWQTLSENGRENLARHFSLDAGRDTIRRVLLAD